jgi:PPOX class probable F420-dependent enzyme
MSLGERMVATSNRFYLRIRHPRAFTAAEAPRASDLAVMDGASYCLLNTFRRSGEAVPTPVWFGVGDGRLYFHSEEQVGKIKRIRNDARVLVGPCTMRGKPVGPMVEGRARVLPATEEDRAERVIQSNYGQLRRLYEGVGGRMTGIDMVYVEVTPTEASGQEVAP